MMEPALKGLLLAIRQEPGCEELKLVLADWLEDHDQSARADLIRLQCQMTPLSERDADRHELQKKVTPLLDRFSDAWAGEPPESITNLKFREGMLDFTGSTSCLVNPEDQQWWQTYRDWVIHANLEGAHFYWREAIDQGKLESITSLEIHTPPEMLPRVLSLSQLRRASFSADHRAITSNKQLRAALAKWTEERELTMKFTGSRYISHGNQLLDSFQELRALRDLQIGYHGSFTRQSLRSLTKLPHLHSLYLRDGVDPGRALEGLTESKSLTHFRISHVLLSEQTIRSLSSLLNLEHLRVCPTERVGLDWMKYLRPLRYLRSLDFSQSRFIEQGELTNLAGLPMLEEINLDGSHITGKGMADLQNLTGLKRVYLDGAGFGGEVLKHLQPLNQLTTLSLRHFQMNDAGAKHLIAHPSLRLIYLSESEVSEKVIKKLKAARPDLIVCS